LFDEVHKLFCIVSNDSWDDRGPAFRGEMETVRSDTRVQLVLIVDFIEVSRGGGYQTIRANRPFLIPADTYGVAGAARTSVCTGQCPVIYRLVSIEADLVHPDNHVRESGHELLCGSGDGCPSHRRDACIDL
jgi:hypothetical protein